MDEWMAERGLAVTAKRVEETGPVEGGQQTAQIHETITLVRLRSLLVYLTLCLTRATSRLPSRFLLLS